METRIRIANQRSSRRTSGPFHQEGTATTTIQVREWVIRGLKAGLSETQLAAKSKGKLTPNQIRAIVNKHIRSKFNDPVKLKSKPQKVPLSREAWIERYGGPELLQREGLKVVPCTNCDDSTCHGWRVIPIV